MDLIVFLWSSGFGIGCDASIYTQKHRRKKNGFAADQRNDLQI